MKIGKLRYRITLIEPIYEEDRLKGRKRIAEKQYEVWADVRASTFSRGNSEKVYDSPVVKNTHVVYIRKKASFGVCRGWGVLIEGSRYEVKSVDDAHWEYTVLKVVKVEVGV